MLFGRRASLGARNYWAALTVAAFAGACSTDSPSEKVSGLTLDLTQEQQKILGFERPTTDWSAPNGTLTASTTVTEGTKALAVSPVGWTEMTSIPLSSLGPVQSTLKVDVFKPAATSWGEVRVILVSPTLNITWGDLGGVAMSTVPVGHYTTVSFAIPTSMQTALAGTYSDLRVKVVVNAPTLSSPYIVDNIVVAQPGGTGGTGGAGGSAGSGGKAGASGSSGAGG